MQHSLVNPKNTDERLKDKFYKTAQNIKNTRQQISTLRDTRLVGNKLKFHHRQSSSKFGNCSNEPQRSSMEFESSQLNSLQNTDSNSLGLPNSSSKQTEEENCFNISNDNNSKHSNKIIQCSSDDNSRSFRNSYEEMETSDSDNLQLKSWHKGSINLLLNFEYYTACFKVTTI